MRAGFFLRHSTSLDDEYEIRRRALRRAGIPDRPPS
jgi:hypothetical protein